MKSFLKAGRTLAILSALGFCLPAGSSIALAGQGGEQSANGQQLSLDVALSSNGALRGIVIDRAGGAAVDAKVALLGSDHKVLETTTDGNGRFLYQNIRPGVYQLAAIHTTGQARKVVRVWASTVAPPVSSAIAILAMNDQPTNDVVRGQEVGTPSPLLLTGVGLGVAAAIAIPVAIANSNRPSSP